MKRPHRGCRACRERKIRCDRGEPACSSCLRAGMTCGGYSDYVRLSWPRDQNSRRSSTALVTPRDHGKPLKIQFVQWTVWDLELFEKLDETEGWQVDNVTRRGLIELDQSPVRWMPHRLSPSDNQLLQYFESTAVRSLTTLSINPVALRSTLLRMAFSSGTEASATVLHSILALTSLHRHGSQSQALRHKAAALQKLSRLVSLGGDDVEAFQYAATGILLCAFEVQQRVDLPENWMLYVSGSRNIVEAASRRRSSWHYGDSAVILSWLHYYDVLARFSARHWRNKDKSCNESIRNQVLGGPLSIPYPTTKSHQVLQLASEIIQSVAHPSDPRYHTDEYWLHMEGLQRQLRQIRVDADTTAGSPSCLPELGINAAAAAKLFKLGALIYMERASRERPGQPAKIRDWVKDAFETVEGLQVCPWPLPLLIIGYEAQTDEQRRVILDVIERTGLHTYVGNLGCLLIILRISWVQEDLGQTRLGYLERLNRIMTMSENAPTLV